MKQPSGSSFVFEVELPAIRVCCVSECVVDLVYHKRMDPVPVAAVFP